MKVKTNTLTDAALDWAAAVAQGHHPQNLRVVRKRVWVTHANGTAKPFQPSTNWTQGGPLLQAEKISVQVDHSGVWIAANYYTYDETTVRMLGGSTMLEAGMRCFVASKLGNEIHIPDELRS